MNNTKQNKVCMISLGCAKNLVDSEILLGGLKQENYEIVKNPMMRIFSLLTPVGFWILLEKNLWM